MVFFFFFFFAGILILCWLDAISIWLVVFAEIWFQMLVLINCCW
jgi:hypothetical protein